MPFRRCGALSCILLATSGSGDEGRALEMNARLTGLVHVPNAHRPFDTPAFTGSLYFNVDDAAALWATVKDHARVCYPIEDFHYGMREFAIFDNNGYLLQFGQPLSAHEEAAS
jgi:uncharacterized glyoxalase superfamily protein PhnB